jgi:uncharacterized protein (DUF1919 family)
MLNKQRKKIVSIFIRIRQFVWNYYEKISQKKLLRKLDNDSFSIVCDNCIGGVIYHRLGKEFLSPTINLYMSAKDYVKFVCDLKYYLSLELVEKESDKPFPVGLLGDVVINFNHAKTFEDASRDWYRRAKRINYDNLFFILYDKEELSDDDIKAFSEAKCNNRVLLTKTRKELPFSVVVPNKSGKRFEYPYFGRTFYGKRFF